MTKLCIDLCSGLGGFSQAFKNSPGWEVVTVDIDPSFNPTYLIDVCDLAENPKYFSWFYQLKPYVILASPPCQRFSLACRTWPKPGIMEAMKIVGACLEIVARFKPQFWILENPKARLRWFLGTPKGTIRLSDYGAPYLKPTDYWGNIDLPFLAKTSPPKMYLRPMKHDQKLPSPIYLSGADAAGRAKMPLGLSQAILKAVSEGMS